jgi:hypothetical protein
MNSIERAEAAYKRLLNTYGAGGLALVCKNPETRKPISRQAVEQWKVVPLIHAKAVAALDKTEWQKIRPDIWDLLK